MPSMLCPTIFPTALEFPIHSCFGCCATAASKATWSSDSNTGRMASSCRLKKRCSILRYVEPNQGQLWAHEAAVGPELQPACRNADALLFSVAMKTRAPNGFGDRVRFLCVVGHHVHKDVQRRKLQHSTMCAFGTHAILSNPPAFQCAHIVLDGSSKSVNHSVLRCNHKRVNGRRLEAVGHVATT